MHGVLGLIKGGVLISGYSYRGVPLNNVAVHMKFSQDKISPSGICALQRSIDLIYCVVAGDGSI